MSAEDHAGRHCTFARSDGTVCPGQVETEEGELCFWHDEETAKEGEDVKARLEEWADSGESMEGFVLRYAHLEGIHLNSPQGRDLRRANLWRAQIQGAHMYNKNGHEKASHSHI